MNKHNTALLPILLILAIVLICSVGCSDMMEKLGKISLTIVLDTPDVAVASYRLEGLHANPNSRLTVNDIIPPRHSLSTLKSGMWSITVTAFDDTGNQIGVGTTRVDLKEGQIVETTLLVVFNQAVPELRRFSFSAPSRFDSTDGQLTGTTAVMEYRLASSSADAPYTPCTEGTTILGAGTYLVRYSAAHGLSSSEPLRLSVPQYQPIQLTIGEPTLNRSKTYDGSVAITGGVTAGALSGIEGTDDVTVSATATYDSKSAGNGKTLTVRYALSGPDTGNYSKPVDRILTGVIEKRQLTIFGTTIDTTKEYDRSPSIAVEQTGTLAGVLGSDDVTCTPTATCSDSTVGSAKPVTITYTLGGGDGDNYHKPVNSTTLSTTITAKPLTVSGTGPTLTKEYDGNISASVPTTGNLIGVEPGDSVTLQATATYTDSRVGDGKPITVSYAITGGDAGNYRVPGNVAFSSGQITHRQLAISNLTLSSNKVYDGTTSVTTPSFSLVGKVLDEDVTVTATAAYDSPTAGTDKQITVSYSIDGEDKNSYLKPVATIASQTGEITKKQLGISGMFVTLDKIYDGNTTAAVTASGTLQGLVAGDLVQFTASASYDTKAVGEDIPVTVVYSLSGEHKENYLKPAEDVRMGIIQRRQLQLHGETAVEATKIYDGNVSAEITQHSSLSNVISGDSVTLHATAAYGTKLAGTGRTIWVYYSIDGADKDNYLQPSDVLATESGIIGKRQLTLSGTTVTATKGYDGSRSATVTSQGVLAGFIDGDAVTIQATASYDSKVVGTNKPITLTYALGGTDKDNYEKPIDSIASETGVITQKQLTVSNLNLTSNKVYDGTTSVDTPSFSLVGKVLGEDVTVTATATYDSPKAESYKRITITYSLDGDDKVNYLKPNDLITTTSCAITKKQLTISDPTLQNNKAYDGTTAIAGTVTVGSLSGVLGSDVVTVAASASYGSSSVAAYNPITVKYTLGGVDAGNYLAPVYKTLWATIVKKPLSVINTVFTESKVYDKTRAITITSNGTLSGFLEGESVVLSSVVAMYATADAGSDKPVTISYTIEGPDAGNYRLDTDTSKKATITNAVLTATVGDYTQHYGGAVPYIVVAVSGFVERDSSLNVFGYSGPTATAGTTQTSAVGTYPIIISGGSAPNYSFDISDRGTLTIEKYAGPAISDTITGYLPASPASPKIINLTGFNTNLSNIEASVAVDGTSFGSYADIAVDSRKRAMIVPTAMVTSASKVRVRIKETTTDAAGPALEIFLSAQDLAIGDYYQGGVVAYIFGSGNPGDQPGTLHGLVAAETDASAGISPWSNSITTIIGTSRDIGTGRANTDKIVVSLGSSAASYAAGMTRAYRGGGYDDWFLPSIDELGKLFYSRQAIGNFKTTSGSQYWSSTEYDIFRTGQSQPRDIVFNVDFDLGGTNLIYDYFVKTGLLYVRAVRYF